MSEPPDDREPVLTDFEALLLERVVRARRVMEQKDSQGRTWLTVVPEISDMEWSMLEGQFLSPLERERFNSDVKVQLIWERFWESILWKKSMRP